MSVAAPATTIQRLDHCVIASNDLGRSYQFWANFMGGRLDHMTNLNQRGLNHEVPQIIFLSVANHRGWGLSLMDFPIPYSGREFEGVAYGFEVAVDNLDGIQQAAEARKIRVLGRVEYPEPSPIRESLCLLDPDNNTVELSIRRDPVSDAPQGEIVPLRRISHARVEVDDLDRGVAWYTDTFGLVEDDQVPGGPEQVTLTIPRTRQLVILHKVDQVAPRSTLCVKGPHLDFRIPKENYPAILAKFDRKEFYWGQDPTKIPWHEAGGHTVYGYDPFGNRIQIGEAFTGGHA